MTRSNCKTRWPYADIKVPLNIIGIRTNDYAEQDRNSIIPEIVFTDSACSVYEFYATPKLH